MPKFERLPPLDTKCSKEFLNEHMGKMNAIYDMLADCGGLGGRQLLAMLVKTGIATSIYPYVLCLEQQRRVVWKDGVWYAA